MRVQSAFAYVVITLYDRLFQAVRLAAGLVTLWFYTDARPTTPSPPLRSQISSFEISNPGKNPDPKIKLNLKSQWKTGFGLFRVRSPLLAESLLFSLPRGTKMVHFPPFAPTAYVFSGW